MTTGPSIAKLFDANSDHLTTQKLSEVALSGLHPLAQAEKLAGIKSEEAARRLGLSHRQYERYRSGAAEIPHKIRLLVELGALDRKPGPLHIDRRIEEWKESRTR